MSALAPTVPAMTSAVHPWRLLGQLAEWTLRWHHREDSSDYGWTDFGAREISLRSDLDQAGRRSTLMHELIHVSRGPSLAGVLAEREELRVRREAARLLLPDAKVIGDALTWARDLDEAAFELWVDADTLRDRLAHLHPAELHYLRRRLADAEAI